MCSSLHSFCNHSSLILLLLLLLIWNCISYLHDGKLGQYWIYHLLQEDA